MKRVLLTLALTIGFTSFLMGQTLISGNQLASFSAADLSAQIGMPVPYGVTAYKILYTSMGSDGSLDTASGLLSVPDDASLSYPMLAYQHGTTNGKQDVPSNLQGGLSLSLAFASQGFIVTSADYIGMGESRGFHPYVHAQTEGQAAVDLLFAAETYLTNQGIRFEDQLFISGYSQGGHAGMAAQKIIEAQYANDFNLVACGHMSGPYSISKVMKVVIFSDVDFTAPAFLPYTVLGYQEVYGNIYTSLDAFFKAPYVPFIQQFYDDAIPLTTMNVQLSIQLSINEGNLYPYGMIQDSVVANVLANPNHPVNVALEDNDVWNFTATTPTRMYYCDADEQVSYINSLYADSAMNANNALDVLAVRADSNQSHGGCAPIATIAVLLFFDQYATIGLEERSTLKGVKTYPQPASDVVNIDLQSSENADFHVFDMAGRLVFQEENVPFGTLTIPVSDWPSGVYLLNIQQNGLHYAQRLVIE